MKMRTTCCIVTVVLLAQKQFAMYPEFNFYGWLVLTTEGEPAPYTRAKAITGGVETWYLEWKTYIEGFVEYGEYNTYLPSAHSCSWSFYHVDAGVLAELIYNDCNLDLGDVPANVIDEIEDMLNKDRYHSQCMWSPNCGRPYPSYIDPYSDWKWRSVYMENRWAANSSQPDFPNAANVHGIADYLAMDRQWYDGFTDIKNRVLNPDYNSGHANIYTDQKVPIRNPQGEVIGYNWQTCEDESAMELPYWIHLPFHHQDVYGNEFPYNIENDLGDEGRYELKGVGNNLSPAGILNAFDALRRYVTTASQTELWWYHDTNLGKTVGTYMYLCTDDMNTPYFFTKGEMDGIGCLYYEPYHIGDIEYGHYSLFKNRGDFKHNLAATWDLMWINE